MNVFSDLLNKTCDIQESIRDKSGYETTTSWQDKETNVPCRASANNNTEMNDSEIRINIDETLFFIETGVDVEQGDRIVFEGENYHVIKVNELHEEQDPHHLEVTGKLSDHD